MARLNADEGAPTPEDSTLNTLSQDANAEASSPQSKREKTSIEQFRELAAAEGITFIEEPAEPGAGTIIVPTTPETEDRVENV